MTMVIVATEEVKKRFYFVFEIFNGIQEKDSFIT